MLQSMIILSKAGKKEAEIPLLAYITMPCDERAMLMTTQKRLGQDWSLREVDSEFCFKFPGLC